MGKLKFLFLFFALIPGTLFSQTISLKQLLKSSLSDPIFKSFDAQQSYLLKSQNFALPWINRMQFRYQDNQFNDFQTRYGLRVEPVNPWHRKHNNQYFQGIQTLKSIEQKMHLKEILRNRYNMVVEFWMASERAHLTTRQKEIREQIGNALGQKSGSTGFDTDQFLNAQLDVIAKEADSHEANFERDVAHGNILAISGATRFDLLFTELIEVDQINQFINTEINTNRTGLELLKQRVEVSGLKMKLEKSNIDLGFLQTMYSTDTRTDRENILGLALGVTIPLANPNKENVAREKMNMMELQGELEQFQLEEKINMASSIANLKLRLDHYQKLDSLIASVKNKGLNLLTGRSNNYDPVIELKYQEKLIQFDLLKAKIKKEVLLQYISFLANADKLHERPMVNYLSKNFENVE